MLVILTSLSPQPVDGGLKLKSQQFRRLGWVSSCCQTVPGSDLRFLRFRPIQRVEGRHSFFEFVFVHHFGQPLAWFVHFISVEHEWRWGGAGNPQQVQLGHVFEQVVDAPRERPDILLRAKTVS